MISAIIVIALLSLLVATEPEQAEHTHPTPEPPLQPAHKKPQPVPAATDRLAA
jgi:hypothetical protein